MKDYLQLKFNRLNKVFSNAGIWFMLILDAIFLCILCVHGFSIPIFAGTIILLSAEVLLVLSKLPKPVINLKASANMLFLFVFATMPILSLIWGITLGNRYLILFCLLSGGRFATYMFSFVLSFVPRFGAIFSGIAIIAFSFTLCAVTIGIVNNSKDFTTRPATYAYVTQNGTKNVALKKLYSGFQKDIKIDKCHLGDVTVIGSKAIGNSDKIANLTFASTVKTFRENAINRQKIDSLTVLANDVVFMTNSVSLLGDTKVMLTGTTADFQNSAVRLLGNANIDINYTIAPELTYNCLFFEGKGTVNISGAYPKFHERSKFLAANDLDSVKLNFSKPLADVAFKDEILEHYYNIMAPITNDGEFYLQFNTSYYGTTGHGKATYLPIKYFTSILGLELPNLEINGYKFLGWYDSTYTQKITGTSFNANTVLYAKTLKIFYISYSLNGGKLHSGEFIEERTIEVGDVILPILKREGYTFTGWFEYSDKLFTTPISVVKKGKEGDYAFIAGFIKNNQPPFWLDDGYFK